MPKGFVKNHDDLPRKSRIVVIFGGPAVSLGDPWLCVSGSHPVCLLSNDVANVCSSQNVYFKRVIQTPDVKPERKKPNRVSGLIDEPSEGGSAGDGQMTRI